MAEGAETVRITSARRKERPKRKTKLVSLVVPVFNEQEAIGPFLDRIGAVLADVGPAYAFEIVFVNDGSRDATEFVIRSRMQDDARL